MLTDRAKEIINKCDAKMKEAINYLEEDLKSYRVGKASPAILNSVFVDYYGTPSPLQNVPYPALGEEHDPENREGHH